jgi:hypothetical protein
MCPFAAFFCVVREDRMATTWLIVIGIIVALGWLYFSSKLRTWRLRVPPEAVPQERRGSRSSA